MPAENGAHSDDPSLHAAGGTGLAATAVGFPPHRKPHAVVVPWPGQGHVNPLLHLSKRLALQGFSITFVNVGFTHARLVSSIRRQEEKEKSSCDQQQEEEVAETTYTSKSLDIKFVCIPDGVSAEDTRTGNVPELCKGVNRSASAFVQLLKELQPPPTCIISDTFVLHTQDAANTLGIPRVSFWTQSAACYAVHLAAARGLLELPASGSVEKIITNIPGAPPLRVADLPSFMACCDWSDFMFDFCVRPFLRMHEAVCVLINSFEAMEGKAMEALREQQPDCKFYTIGPTLPVEYFSGKELSQSFINKAPGFWAEDYRCMEWLDKQEEGSVLYVSFGSVMELTEEELEDFSLGLEATGFPILWVLRLEGGGHLALPPGFARRTNGHVFIIEWAPQLHVLAHPSVGAFFTHGGWNSTLEAVSQGKPLLGFPYFADQMINCRCIEDEWCNGLALEQHGRSILTRSLVETKARIVMTDTKLRATALQLRNAARRAILSNDPSSSTTNFNSMIHVLANPHTI